LLRAPKIFLSFIGLSALLRLLSLSGQPFGLLISPARRVGALAAGEEGGASDQANELKMLHTCLNISSKSECRSSKQILNDEISK
jgi:hypothetical protein